MHQVDVFHAIDAQIRIKGCNDPRGKFFRDDFFSSLGCSRQIGGTGFHQLVFQRLCKVDHAGNALVDVGHIEIADDFTAYFELKQFGRIKPANGAALQFLLTNAGYKLFQLCRIHRRILRSEHRILVHEQHVVHGVEEVLTAVNRVGFCKEFRLRISNHLRHRRAFDNDVEILHRNVHGRFHDVGLDFALGIAESEHNGLCRCTSRFHDLYRNRYRYFVDGTCQFPIEFGQIIVVRNASGSFVQPFLPNLIQHPVERGIVVFYDVVLSTQLVPVRVDFPQKIVQLHLFLDGIDVRLDGTIVRLTGVLDRKCGTVLHIRGQTLIHQESKHPVDLRDQDGHDLVVFDDAEVLLVLGVQVIQQSAKSGEIFGVAIDHLGNGGEHLRIRRRIIGSRFGGSFPGLPIENVRGRPVVTSFLQIGIQHLDRKIQTLFHSVRHIARSTVDDKVNCIFGHVDHPPFTQYFRGHGYTDVRRIPF